MNAPVLPRIEQARVAWARRWFWLRNDRASLIARRDPTQRGPEHDLYREYGAWVIRPRRGWRRHRWITLPAHATRAISAGDHNAAVIWALDAMGI